MHRSVATLRIIADDLVPAEVSTLLNGTPTRPKKGDVIIGGTGVQRTARTGMWSLHSEEHEPEKLDGQIEEILRKLTSKTEVCAAETKGCRSHQLLSLGDAVSSWDWMFMGRTSGQASGDQ
jgi:hypothetical protein